VCMVYLIYLCLVFVLCVVLACGGCVAALGCSAGGAVRLQHG
jgi:hypothetical protein